MGVDGNGNGEEIIKGMECERSGSGSGSGSRSGEGVG